MFQQSSTFRDKLCGPILNGPVVFDFRDNLSGPILNGPAVIDVSGQPIGDLFKVQAVLDVVRKHIGRFFRGQTVEQEDCLTVETVHIFKKSVQFHLLYLSNVNTKEPINSSNWFLNLAFSFALKMAHMSEKCAFSICIN